MDFNRGNGGGIVGFVVNGGDTSLGVGCRVKANSIQSPIRRNVASDKRISRLPRLRTNEISISASKSLVNLGLLAKPIVRFVEMKQAKKAIG